MKLTKAQTDLLTRVVKGEHIRRNGNLWNWYSTDIDGDHVHGKTVRVLLDCGLLEQKVVSNGYSHCTELFRPIDYAADSGDFDTASRITPDPAGEDAAADDGRPVDVLRTAHTYRAVMARLYGTYSARAQRAATVFESLFAVRNVKFA